MIHVDCCLALDFKKMPVGQKSWDENVLGQENDLFKGGGGHKPYLEFIYRTSC